MALTQLNINPTVGQLVVERPQRGKLFESLGIDYCCAGRTSLEEACARRGLNAADVRAKLQEFDISSPAAEKDWSKVPLTVLVDDIVKNHHGKMREELPRIERLLENVLNAHGAKHPELSIMSRTFAEFSRDLPHIWIGKNLFSFHGSDHLNRTPQQARAIFACAAHPRHDGGTQRGRKFVRTVQFTDRWLPAAIRRLCNFPRSAELS